MLKRLFSRRKPAPKAVTGNTAVEHAPSNEDDIDALPQLSTSTNYSRATNGTPPPAYSQKPPQMPEAAWLHKPHELPPTESPPISIQAEVNDTLALGAPGPSVRPRRRVSHMEELERRKSKAAHSNSNSIATATAHWQTEGTSASTLAAPGADLSPEPDTYTAPDMPFLPDRSLSFAEAEYAPWYHTPGSSSARRHRRFRHTRRR